MKWLLSIALIWLTGLSIAQVGGTTCQGMTPICTDVGLSFVANTGGVNIVNAYPTNNYGCMWTGPNPSWYYIEVDIAGNIDMTLAAPSDIDFVLWGPYSSVADATANCGNLGNAPGNDVVIDCGISPAATEFVNVTNAQVGQVYVLVIANFAGTAQNITLTQTGGTGGTDCSILPNCIMTSIDAIIGSCQPTNTFSVTGTFTYDNSPTSGTVNVQVTNGSGTYTQTFNPPFVNNQTYNFTVGNIPSDGSPLTVNVFFSSDPNCSLSVNSTSPASCSCAADIGTYTATVNSLPATSNSLVICYGDSYSINSNGDYTGPAVANNPPGPAYDPGVSWLLYSCPPTIALVPSATDSLTQDPCLLGIISDINVADVNNLALINAYPPGTFTNNTVYLMPVTMYSMVDNYYSYVNTSLPCYETGPVFAVQYVPEFSYTSTQDCYTGTVTITPNGGLPSINSSGYTVVAGTLIPSTASFVNTSCGAGGTIGVTGLTNGQTYSFDIEDNSGCNISVSGVFTGLSPVTLTYPQTSYCIDEGPTSPSVNGSAGGAFTSTAGLVIDPATGVIQIANSIPGTYTVNYTSPAGSCAANASFTLTIHPLPIVDAGNAIIVCSNEPITLSASGANTYAWDNGVLNGIPFIPPLGTTTYTVTGTSLAGCSSTDQVNVTVNGGPPVTFVADTLIGCSPLTVQFTNTTPNVQFCTWDFGNGTSSTSCGTVSQTFVIGGCYDITLSIVDNFGCGGTLSNTDMICVEENPDAGFIPSTNSVSEINSTVLFTNTTVGATSFLWDFGDFSPTSSLEDANHDYLGNELGNYIVTLIASTPFGCADTAAAVIVMREDLLFYVPNTFTPDGDTYNEEFTPIFYSGFDADDYHLTIFNRWGEIVFESYNYEKGWDGSYGSNKEKTAQQGTYTWKIEFKTTRNDERKTVVGHVTILR
jgi:gliding motility-associated-like protein